MKAKEAANYLVTECQADDPNWDEILACADVLARHVLVLDGDPEISLLMTADQINAIAQQTHRYRMLLKQIGIENAKERDFIEKLLDDAIAKQVHSASTLLEN